jgi:acetyl-CoA C-acetyltransferase
MQQPNRSVYIIDGARTPFIKAAGKPNPLSALELAIAAAGPLLARQSFTPEAIEEVVAGCVIPSPNEANIGRLIALRLGCGRRTMGWTVQRNCASGLQALDCAFLDIANGRHDLVLAGGTECLSRTPLLYSEDFVAWLSHFRAAKGFVKKLSLIFQVKPHFFVPVISLLKGLTDPIVNLSMGQTAEVLAYQFGITREQMDEYSVQSHQKVQRALENGFLNEILPLYDWQGNVITFDNGIRPDSSVQKLATLKPAFDKPFGKITAGNSSQVSDGAAFLILASEAAVKRYHLPVEGRIIDTQWAGLDPTVMGLGPVHAIHKLLLNQNLAIKDIDYWEINEAFAAQVLACVKVMQDENYCRAQLGLEHALGILPMEKLNIDGGAIAVGHPVGASGARLVLHLLQVLKNNNAKRGIASLCIGGGQGGAMLIERVEGI